MLRAAALRHAPCAASRNFCSGFRIELQATIGLTLLVEAHPHREFEIGAVGHLVVALRSSASVVMPEAAIVDVARRNWLRVRLAGAERFRRPRRASRPAGRCRAGARG